MGDNKKSTLASAAEAARTLLKTPTFTLGLPRSVTVTTNVNSTENGRFPLPLTIGSGLVAALGLIAVAKGHKKSGAALVVLGSLGLGAAAAAPELNQALAKVGQA